MPKQLDRDREIAAGLLEEITSLVVAGDLRSALILLDPLRRTLEAAA